MEQSRSSLFDRLFDGEQLTLFQSDPKAGDRVVITAVVSHPKSLLGHVGTVVLTKGDRIIVRLETNYRNWHRVALPRQCLSLTSFEIPATAASFGSQQCEPLARSCFEQYSLLHGE